MRKVAEQAKRGKMDSHVFFTPSSPSMYGSSPACWSGPHTGKQGDPTQANKTGSCVLLIAHTRLLTGHCKAGGMGLGWGGAGEGEGSFEEEEENEEV